MKRGPLLFIAAALFCCLSLVAKDFNVLDFGAKGDGTTLDTTAIQRAIDAAGENGGTVVIPKDRQFLVATLVLRSGVEFHLDGELLISTNQSDYSSDGVITASNALNLKITGSGKITGRSLSFMTGYDATGEWWLFKEWRPKIFMFTACSNVIVRDITFGDAPYWGLHLLGCRNIVVDHLTVTNRLNVPNCDGIDLDHCQNAAIRGCHITSGDDAIVVKATRQLQDYGSSDHIIVTDCMLETQDSGLKIGTETVSDVHDVAFDHCIINRSSRALTIQLRDEGSVYNVVFRHITFISRYHSDPWWGRGEAISLTAIPRTATTKLGTLHNIQISDVVGRAENSVRIRGCADSRPYNIVLDGVAITLDRWTSYHGGLFDNRPTKVLPEIEPHGTPGFSISQADRIVVKHCRVNWGTNCPDYFTYALQTENTTKLWISDFTGEAAHPGRDKARSLK